MTDYTKKTVELLLQKHKPYLIEILKNQGIDVKESDNLTADEICSLISSQNDEPDFVLESSIYRCSCGSKLIIVREVQLRSADEGSSVVRLCRECGRKW